MKQDVKSDEPGNDSSDFYHNLPPPWDFSTSTNSISNNNSPKMSKKSVDKGKEKTSDTPSLPARPLWEPEKENYEQDAGEARREQDAGQVAEGFKGSRRRSHYTTKNWSTGRKLILLKSYMNIRPFTAQRGKICKRWDQIAGLVNSQENDTLGKVQRRSCQQKVDQLMDFYTPIFDKEQDKNLFSDDLEKAAYRVYLMKKAKLSKSKKKNKSNKNTDTTPTTMQTHRLKRKINNVSTAEAAIVKEEDNEQGSKSSWLEDAPTQYENIQAETEQDHAEEPLRPLDYLQYLENLKYLPVIANALNAIAQQLEKMND